MPLRKRTASPRVLQIGDRIETSPIAKRVLRSDPVPRNIVTGRQRVTLVKPGRRQMSADENNHKGNDPRGTVRHAAIFRERLH